MRRTAPVPLSPHAHRQHTSTAHKAYAWKVRWMAGGGGPTTGPPALFTPLLPQGGRGWASLPLLTPPAASTWPPSVLTMTPPPIIVHAHLPGFSYQGFPTRVFLPGLSYLGFFPTRAFLPELSYQGFPTRAFLPGLFYLQDLLPTCLYGFPTCRTCLPAYMVCLPTCMGICPPAGHAHACMPSLPQPWLLSSIQNPTELRPQPRYPRQPPRPPAPRLIIDVSQCMCVCHSTSHMPSLLAPSHPHRGPPPPLVCVDSYSQATASSHK